MTIDIKRMAGELVEARKMMGNRGDLWKIPEGETRVFVHGQVYPDDDHPATQGYNFIKVFMHHGLGGKKGGVVCLDPKLNPIITHPIVQKFLAERKKGAFKLGKNPTCPTCTKLAAGEVPTEDAERITPKARWLFGLTPMFFRLEKTDDWAKLKFEPKMLMASVSIFNGIAGDMIDNANAGIDVTDPVAAVLAKIGRTGTGFGDTNYEVKFDVETVRNPIRLDKGQRRLLAEAMKPGGGCDLFRCVAMLMKSPAQISALMVGTRVEEDEAEDERKSCFGIDFDPHDTECKGCSEIDACSDATAGESSESPETGKRPAAGPPTGRNPKRPGPEADDSESKDEPKAQFVDADGDPCNEDGSPIENESEGESEGEANADPESGAADSEDPVDIPQCFTTFEAESDDCESCMCGKECKDETLAKLREKAKAPARLAKPLAAAPKKESPEKEAEDEDPELAAIEREAKALANKNKSRGKPFGKK
jgi:hypothetical protein